MLLLLSVSAATLIVLAAAGIAGFRIDRSADLHDGGSAAAPDAPRDTR